MIKEGGMFRDGYDSRLDELRDASKGGKDWIAALQQREIERTGIKSLKVRFNSVFGYFIEVSNSNLGRCRPITRGNKRPWEEKGSSPRN